MKSVENIGKFYLRPYVKYAFHCANFYETDACCTTFCTEHLYHISQNLANG
jgi:hypothetical protein